MAASSSKNAIREDTVDLIRLLVPDGSRIHSASGNGAGFFGVRCPLVRGDNVGPDGHIEHFTLSLSVGILSLNQTRRLL